MGSIPGQRTKIPHARWYSINKHFYVKKKLITEKHSGMSKEKESLSHQREFIRQTDIFKKGGGEKSWQKGKKLFELTEILLHTLY